LLRFADFGDAADVPIAGFSIKDSTAQNQTPNIFLSSAIIFEHLPVARLENMQRQKLVRQQNERQRKQRQMPNAQNFF
jgi:hypothetical protein